MQFVLYMKNTVLILAIMMLFVACKKEKPSNMVTEPTPIIIENDIKELIIKLSFKTNKSDVFKIMVNNIAVDELQKKNIHISEEVVPTSGVDKISANFGDNNISNNVLINFGNKEVKEVEIMDITVIFGNNQISLKTPEDQNRYLNFNKFIEKDTTSNKLRTKRVNGAHNQTIYFKRNLVNLLKKE